LDKLLLEQEDDSMNKRDGANEINTYSTETSLQSLNESLQSACESEVRLERIGETKNTAMNVAKIENAVRKKIFGIPSHEGTSALPARPNSTLLQKLKEKFDEPTNSSVKITILTHHQKD
jgi:hypothetical protein